MAADRSRLAAALAYKQAEEERRRRMLESIPTPAGTTPAQPAPQADFRTNLENLSIGLGEGLTNQLEGIKGLITDPVGTAKGVYEAGKAVVRDPAIIASALRQMGQKAMSGPLGAGEVIGEMIGPRKTGPVMAELDVYHGTPHRFPATEANPLGEFDASKIGTGEGAQAYGHGIYYAENPKVAKGYQSSLSADRGFSFEGKTGLTRAEVQDMVNAKYGKGYLDNILRPSGVADSFIDDMVTGVTRAEGTYPKQYKAGSERAKLYDELRGKITHASPGSLYKADLPDEMIDRMLDWDKPLSEQPKGIQEKLSKFTKPQAVPEYSNEELELQRLMFGETINQNPAPLNPTGSQILGDLIAELGEKEASAYLKNLGITGIKYLDEGSRNTAGKWIAKHPQGGETAFNTEAELNAFLKRNPEMAAVKPKQTRNFVVFPGEEKKVRILERDGQKAPPQKIAQALESAPRKPEMAFDAPEVKPGDIVDGLKVRPEVANVGSIKASLDNYTVLPGIRSVSIADFGEAGPLTGNVEKLDRRTRNLADQITESKEITPLIVVYSGSQNYILEGSHRIDALDALGKKRIPVIAVIDEDDPPKFMRQQR